MMIKKRSTQQKSNEELALTKKRRIVAIISILFFVVIIGLITYFAGEKIAEISKDPTVFREWISSFGFWGWLIFILLAAVQVVLAVIPGGPVQIAAGYAFGLVAGSVLCTVGIQIGSAIAFLLVRHLGLKILDLFFSREKIESVKFLQDSKRLDLIVFICFLIPGAPKDLLTYFCGLTKIKFWRFMLLTTLARIPSIILSVMSGNALVSQQYKNAIIIITVICICSIIGAWVYKCFMSSESKKSNKNNSSTIEK